MALHFEIASCNGKIIPIKEAVVPVSNLEYAYGFGVYETIRVKQAVPFFIDDHLERLLLSAKKIQLSHQLTKSLLNEYVKELLTRIKEPAYNLKIMLVGGTTPETSTLFIQIRLKRIFTAAQLQYLAVHQ